MNIQKAATAWETLDPYSKTHLRYKANEEAQEEDLLFVRQRSESPTTSYIDQ